MAEKPLVFRNTNTSSAESKTSPSINTGLLRGCVHQSDKSYEIHDFSLPTSFFMLSICHYSLTWPFYLLRKACSLYINDCTLYSTYVHRRWSAFLTIVMLCLLREVLGRGGYTQILHPSLSLPGDIACTLPHISNTVYTPSSSRVVVVLVFKLYKNVGISTHACSAITYWWTHIMSCRLDEGTRFYTCSVSKRPHINDFPTTKYQTTKSEGINFFCCSCEWVCLVSVPCLNKGMMKTAWEK